MRVFFPSPRHCLIKSARNGPLVVFPHRDQQQEPAPELRQHRPSSHSQAASGAALGSYILSEPAERLEPQCPHTTMQQIQCSGREDISDVYNAIRSAIHRLKQQEVIICERSNVID